MDSHTPVYMDSLTSRHSGISNDVLLFSDMGLSLVHHYRVHKRGLPHVTFRRNYMSQLRALLPLPTVLPIAGGGGGGGRGGGDDGRLTLPARLCHVRRNLRTWCVPRLDHPDARSVAGGQYGSWSRLYRMLLDSLAVAGAVVLDCRPPVVASIDGD